MSTVGAATAAGRTSGTDDGLLGTDHGYRYRNRGAFSITSIINSLRLGVLEYTGASSIFAAADDNRILQEVESDTTNMGDDRQTATSPTVNDESITLVLSVNTTSVFAGAPALDVTVAARDQNGDLVPDYRGSVTFSSTSGFTVLPRRGLGKRPYTFTAEDGGEHTWTGVTLQNAGEHTISVGDGTHSATSPTITVQAVDLTLSVSSATVFAGEPALDVTVAARDQNGDLVPGYRGSVTFSSTSGFTVLPRRGLGKRPYTFTAEDGGEHTWTGVTLQNAGEHTISVGDGTRSATSPTITVQAVDLTVSVSSATVFAGEPALDVTVAARNQNGDLVPGYRGAVTFSSTSGFSGLPRSGLGNLPYTFTAEDGGEHTWTGVTLQDAGEHTISVGDGTRSATSPTITVQAVDLTLSVSSTSVFAGEPALAVTVAARDQNGDLVPGYRGAVTFSSTSGFSGLPRSGLGNLPYTFTAEDGGEHTWTGVTLQNAGEHTISVGDGTRSATSDTVTVEEVELRVNWSATSSYVNDRTLSLTIKAVDTLGNLVTGYRGALDLNPSVTILGLPQGPLATPDYTFTEDDAGQRTFETLGFTEAGEQSLTVVDRANSNRQTTAAVTVGWPPDPEPIPPGPMYSSYTVPTQPPTTPEPLTMQWGIPFIITNTLVGSNSWRGYPDQEIPAAPGTFYFISGMHWRTPGEWWASTFYTCPYLAWEDELTSVRQSGGGIDGGPGAQDTSAFDFGYKNCTKWSDRFNNGAAVGFNLGPITNEFGAPAETEGVHLDIQTAGNSSGGFIYAVGAPTGFNCEAPGIADPIDSRSGHFYLLEQDLGAETGCTDVALQFQRRYSLEYPSGDALGPAWVHSFEQRITVSNPFVLVQGPQGGQTLFKDVGGDVYASQAGTEQILQKRPDGGWALIYRNQRVDLFAADGRLVAQQDPNGNLHWMTYEEYDWLAPNGTRMQGSRLARVDAPGGRYLWFGYDYYNPGRLVVVGDNAGRSVNYSYDDMGRLIAVTDPTGATETYQYLENDTLWVLESQTDANGDLVFQNTYDDRVRVIHQVNNQGPEISFQYDLSPDTDGLTDGTGAAPYVLSTTATDQNGAQVVYTYGADGLLRTITDPAGATTEYRGYTDTRRATEITDGLGRTTTISYNDLGLPETVTNPLNETTTYTYDDWGRPTGVTDALNRTTQFSYTGPNLTTITDAEDQTVTLTYTEQAGWNGMLTAIADQEGSVTTLTYDALGDLVAIQDALGHETTMEYDALGRPTSITDARENTTALTYDDADRVTSITDPLGEQVTMTYDALDNLTTITDQSGATTTISYTLMDKPTVFEDALGNTVTRAYDELGRPSVITDQRGQQQTLTYDLAGRVTATTDALGHTTRYGYDVLGNTTVITDANGHATTITYDALNRPTEVRNAEGHFIQYGYDAVGNVTVLTDTLGHTATVQYDALNRPVVSTDQEGRTTQSTYTPRGLLASSTDGAGSVTRYTYDALGQLEQVLANAQGDTAPSADVNVATSYTYDAVGNLLTVTDPNDNTTSFGYDARNQRISLTDQLDRVWQSTYDARGLLETWTKPDNAMLSYSYDALGQLTTLTTPDETITRAYDAAGNLVSLSDQTGTTTVAYDALNRPLTVTLSVGGTVGYGYDAVGNRTSTRYPDGSTVQIDYNAANQPVQYDDWSGGTTTLAYDPNGRLETTTRPNGAATTYSYDRSGLPTQISHTAGGTTVGDYQYTYDATGRRVQAIENGTVITATYDGLYRLRQQQASNGTSYAYSYDASGNRLTAQEPGQNTTATYDAANQLATLNGATVQYDANGNLINDGSATYAYDAMDRLIRVTRGMSETTFAYNGNGDRVGQAVDGAQTTYVLDLNAALTQVLAQQGSAGTTRFLAGVGQEMNGVWQYHHSDALGSLRALTDSNGAVVGTADYTPFGAVAQAAGVLAPQGFTGEFQDNGLVYLRARYYHPTLGRFLTPDSIVPDATNGQDWNAYAYVRNDPWNWVDPSGHSPLGNNLRDQLGDAWRWAQGQGQQLGDWWNTKPECGCGGEDAAAAFLSNWGGPLALQGAWGLYSSPAGKEGISYTEHWGKFGKWRAHIPRQIDLPRWLPRLGGRSLPIPLVGGRSLAVPTFAPGWHRTSPDVFGPVPTRRFAPQTERIEQTGWRTRNVIKSVTGTRWNFGGLQGVFGTIGIGALIDAGVQFGSDMLADPCGFTPAERFARAGVAFGFGLLTAAVGTGVFGALLATGAPGFAAAAAGVGISYGFGVALNPWKQEVFDGI